MIKRLNLKECMKIIHKKLDNDEFFYIKKRDFGNLVDLVSVPRKMLKNIKKHYNAGVYSTLKFNR